MNFLNPLVLVALVAAFIPLLLHLLTLRKLRPFPFSSLRFLRELQRSTVRRFRLRQLLLLAVRMGLVAALVLAFARPVIPGKLPLLGQRAPVSIVLVVDNSASMAVVDEQGERFRRLQDYAQRFIRSLQPEDELVLLPVAAAGAPLPEWSSSHGVILESLARLAPRPEQGDLLAALRRAAVLVQQARHLHRFVLVLSDFQKSALGQLPEGVRLFDAHTQVYAVNVGQASPLRAGVVVDSVALETQLRAVGEPVTFTVRVRAFGKDTADAVVGLFWDGERVAQRRLRLAAGQVQSLTLGGIPSRAGFVHAWVLAEGDVQTTVGERRFAGFAVPEPFPVGVVAEGEARTFVEAALGAFPAQRSPFRVEFLSPSALATADMSRFPVLIVASSGLGAGDLERLEAFLRAGGGVLLFAAGGSTAEVLPAWLARLGLGRAGQREFAAGQEVAITQAETHHPLFAGVFTGRGDQLPENPRLRRLVLVSGGIPLLTSPAGPVLTEQQVGQGRLLFCGVAPELGWGELPRSGLFPTLLVRSALLLGPAAAPTFFHPTGEQGTLTLPTAPPAVTVRDPTGTQRFLSPVQLGAGSRLELGYLGEPGVYEIRATDGTPLATVNVNIPSAELQLDYASPERIREWFQQLLRPRVSFHYHASPEELLTAAVQGGNATELWRYFLFLALLLAIAEIFLSRVLKQDVVETPA